MKAKTNNSITTVTFLTRDQIDYLDKLGKDSLFKYGRKLSRAKILSELVRVLMELGITMEEIEINGDDLHEAILKVIKDEARQKHNV